MNKDEILNAIGRLAKGQGFYGRLYTALTSGSDEAEAYLAELESMKFADVVDLILYIEG